MVRLCARLGHTVGRRNFSSRSREWLGINSEYVSMRGLGIATRVLQGLPAFVRRSHGNSRIFTIGSSDEVQSSMFVLSQFPIKTRVDLFEFVQGAEQAAHRVLQRLYTQDLEATETFLQQLATPSSLQTLLKKPSCGQKKDGRRAVLEQLSVESAVVAGVEYTWERWEEDIKSEWLTIQMQYDVTEHLLISSERGESLEDRRVMKTHFAWTFEAEVTEPEEVEWGIVAATPFQEESRVLTTQRDEEGK